jgi:hypothetical protein
MGTRLRTRSLVAGVLLASLVAAADPAAACTYVARPQETDWPTLDQAAQASDAVVGRVLAQTTLSDPPPYEGRRSPDGGGAHSHRTRDRQRTMRHLGLPSAARRAVCALRAAQGAL